MWVTVGVSIDWHLVSLVQMNQSNETNRNYFITRLNMLVLHNVDLKHYDHVSVLHWTRWPLMDGHIPHDNKAGWELSREKLRSVAPVKPLITTEWMISSAGEDSHIILTSVHMFSDFQHNHCPHFSLVSYEHRWKCCWSLPEIWNPSKQMSFFFFVGYSIRQTYFSSCTTKQITFF